MTGRRRWYAWAAVAYLVIIVVVVLGLLGLYRASRNRLDEALGDRLLGVAGSLAVMIDADRVFNYTVGDSSAAVYLELLGADFLQLARAGDLAEITLCDPDGVVLASSSGNLVPGQANGFWELDRPAVELALGGVPAATGLYRLQSTFQKSAHVPLFKEDALLGDGFVAGIITVSGNPDFFDSLDRLRKGALLTGAAVLVVLVLMGMILHSADRSLERYRASLLQQENLAAMGRMTAGIAHEIRNPLGIIRGAGQHLQRVLAAAGIEDEVADFIPAEVDRLDNILGGYLAFGSGAPAVAETFDPAPVVRRSVDLLAEDLAVTGVEIETDLAEDLAVRGDPRRLQQVLLNLLLNARDAMAAAGKVTVTLAEERDRVVLRIRDRGRGLDGLAPDRLFEPFYTTKEKGSGLGLALSRQIVEEMGGTLELERAPDGIGAVAVIDLPRQGER